jgi:peptidoglycan hydrolase-like protein with peptidoglycan-binding domain
MIRRILLVSLIVVVAGAAGAAAIGFGGGRGGAPEASTLPPRTVQVTRATLVDYLEVDGETSFGDPLPLRYTPPAAAAPPASPPASHPPTDDGLKLVTWLPPVGSSVERGKPVLRVDNRPVVLLYGPLPLYRGLAIGMEGPDVKQLEENLRALGYTGFTVDEEFSASTAAAVRRWQRSLDVPETGAVAPGQVVYAPGAVRIAEHKLRVGDSATGEVLTYTTTARQVKATVEPDKQRYLAVGTAVTVLVSDGSTLAGTVDGVRTSTEGQPRLEVLVSAAGQLPDGPVKVRFVVAERKDVLTVPVTALVALAEGGYGLQVVEGGTTRYVAVETGLFARGRVEIKSGGVREGTTVVVPR